MLFTASAGSGTISDSPAVYGSIGKGLLIGSKKMLENKTECQVTKCFSDEVYLKPVNKTYV